VEKKTYLGDGAYVEFDGFGLWITTENGLTTTNRIYLEPSVLESLIRFAGQHYEMGKLIADIQEPRG